jgi:hypothetical protein
MLNRLPLITYSPLANKQQVMLGVCLRVHATGNNDTLLAQSLKALGPIWPALPSIVLVDFAGESRKEPPLDWEPPESTVILGAISNDARGAVTSNTSTNAARRCLHVSDVAEMANHQAAFFSVAHSALGELPRLVAKSTSPILVLDVNEPIDQARANNGGAMATSGWSCLGWKRRPADKKVGLLSNILKLLQLIDKDADTIDLEAILKRDAVLSYKIVALVNSAAFGLAVEVTSIRHALSILGRQKLKRWLSLLLLQAGGNDTPQVLLQVAFIRAAFLEGVGKSLGLDAQEEDLFLCGAFSLLDKILGIPLTELLGRISISEAITDALVGDEGPLAPLLTLIKGVEARDALFLGAQCELLAISPEEVNRSLLAAISSTKEVSSL